MGWQGNRWKRNIMTEGLYCDGIERMIFKDGKRVELCEEGVEIGGARVLKAVHGV